MAHTIFNGTMVPHPRVPNTYYYFDELIKSKIQGYVAAYNRRVAKAKHTKKLTKILERIKNPTSRIMWNTTNYYDYNTYIDYHTIDHVIDIARTRIQQEVMGGLSPHPSDWDDEYGGHHIYPNPAMSYLKPGPKNKKHKYVSGQRQFGKWLAQYIDRMWQIYQI